MTPPSHETAADEFPVAFSPLSFGSSSPRWTGEKFRIGELETSVLRYETGDSGWTDQLTEFHEDTAGENHYIDLASRSHTVKQLRRWLRSDRPVLIDIGCSSGWMLNTLRHEFSSACILGADYILGPLEKLADTVSGVPLLQFDLTNCPLPDACVDGIVLLNVLEHIERDEDALRHVARILKPGGVVVIEVPAGPQLYDVYDKLLFHCRRYRMNDLLVKVERSGLRVLEKSHMGFFLYPAFWATKKLGQRHLNDSEDVQKAVVAQNINQGRANPVLHSLMNLEAALRAWIDYPVGIRCLVTCEKSKTA